MPLAGYTCPPGSPTAGERHSIHYCLGQCAEPCVSPPLLAAIYTAEHANHHTGAYISASMLNDSGCARQVVLERFEPFYEQPKKRWWPFRGTIAHAIVEDCGGLVEPYGWMQELRMRVELEYPEERMPEFDEDGNVIGFTDAPLRITLGGTTDAYNPRLRQIHDFKSLADQKVAMMGEAGEVDQKYETQLNIYGYLCARTRLDSVDAEGRTIRERMAAVGFDAPADMVHMPKPERLIIQGFSMMELLRSGASQQIKIKRPGQKWAKAEVADIKELRVWSMEETEAYIRPRALAWYKYLILREPAPVATEENSWICKNCSFNGEVIEGERCFPQAERLGRSLPVLDSTTLELI